jgi:hypothetical protein
MRLLSLLIFLVWASGNQRPDAWLGLHIDGLCWGMVRTSSAGLPFLLFLAHCVDQSLGLCPKGQYEVTGGSICKDCPAGYLSAGLHDTFECNSCSKGRYQPHAKMDACIACPSGMTTKQLSATKGCEQCPSGRSALGFPDAPGRSPAKAKPNKKVSTDDDAHKGSAKDDDDAAEKASAECTGCSTGMVQPRSGQSSCVNCAHGLFLLLFLVLDC